MFRYRSNGTRYDVNLINDDGVYLQKWVDYFSVSLWRAAVSNSNGQWYKITVEAVGEKIKVFINDVEYINVTDANNPILEGDVGLQVWPGYYIGCGGVTTTRFDDFIIHSIEKSPIILLPGLGASWNYEAMILDQEKLPEEWSMTPGVKVYDGLIGTLVKAGYTSNENLFIFNYDWRKPIVSIADDLKSYISRHPPPTGTKIILIGHSLGGLVARTYLQNNPDNQIEKLITVGSPHQGALKTYYIWEGADLSKGLSGWQRIGAGILLQLKRKGFENDVTTIRNMLPVLKDLLPTFPYLRDRSRVKSPSELIERNTWLEGLNSSPLTDDLARKTTTILGKGIGTIRWINVGSPNGFDSFLGKWKDGKPLYEEFGSGDKTVLDFSARLANTHVVEINNQEHSDLVINAEGQQSILDALGLSSSTIITEPSISYVPSLVFQIASPATITVLDPSGNKVLEDVKMGVVTNPVQGRYQIQVKAEGQGGNFRFLTGRIMDSSDLWSEEDGTVTENQTKTYFIDFRVLQQFNKVTFTNLAKDRLVQAKTQSAALNSSAGLVLVRILNLKISEVDKILYYYQRGINNLAVEQIKNTVIDLNSLDSNIQRQYTYASIPLDKRMVIINLLKEAKSYLIQSSQIQ